MKKNQKNAQPQAKSRTPLKVLMVSHMDPRLSNGGAEIAAFQLYNQLLDTGDVDGWFLSAAPNKIERKDGVVFAQPFDDRSYVYAGGAFNHFLHGNTDAMFFEHARELLADINPDIVHFHHYTNFGVEMFKLVKDVCPKAKVILTLHEFLAICNHFGQMVKRGNFMLCNKSGARECAKCFPEHSPQDFFLRKAYLMRYFGEVDHFISPSHFLAERYIEWGVDREKMSVIENGSPHIEPRRDDEPASASGVLRVGFFGQISKLKGVNVILDAAEILANDEDTSIRIDIHGDYSSQPPDLQAEFLARIKDAPGNINYFGPYDNSRVSQLMATVDAVLVPSIWWENSPLVIQEALARGRPVICSDIGGMKEKVRPGLDGFHFQAGSGLALANLLKELAENRNRLDSLRSTISTPPTISETAFQTGEIYNLISAER
ncbi:glycosyltransferase involved in cell wall biosynthesis [Rhizobium sp. SG_E_25_P2]|uniref:glycosyltransferase family 4 protein n=1 Tax=Rhizobium sp. SG_E_25_P2 TaxID=2879942 RepID=UPI0024762B0A|nr:glycosyltransferase family 4 protein [Rhizobium sp. SG_E_25_P2]MDH6266387.1 glycosyltransferase involved in cell wall biosynthesis [Rhizobium sp. SG_E_25_P2]